MARGKMFYITKDPLNCEDFSAACISESVDSLGVDYVADVDDVTAMQDIQDFANRLMDAGFKIQFPDKDEMAECPDMAFKICPTDVKSLLDMKKNYFRTMFSFCQEAMATMTLDAFASDAATISGLRLKLNNTIGDMVMLNGESLIDASYSMDTFIRNMSAGVCYYISKNVVLLH